MALNVGDIHNFKGPKGNNDYRQVQLMGHKYQTSLRKHGITLSDVIIWHKNEAWSRHTVSYRQDIQHTSYPTMVNWEPVYIFRKKGEREIPSAEIVLHSKLTRQQWISWVPSVWKIDPVQNMDGHPSIYPDELVRRLVLMFSYVGDTVLDPFLGSGTTVKVARELGRDAVGYERDPKYKEVIMRRLGEESLTADGMLKQMVGSLAEMGGLSLQGDEETPRPEWLEPEGEQEVEQAESMEAGESE